MQKKWSKTAHKVHQNMILNNLLSKRKKILIAFSGGRDSVFLFQILQELNSFWKCEFVIGHINHSLRIGEDQKESEFTKEFALKNGVKLLEEKVDVRKYSKENGLSIEESARELRYEVFEKWMKKTGIDYLFTGHHKSDQAETIMYRLFSGSGFYGLSGIPQKRGKIVRPILDISRKEIDEYIFENNLEFMEDSSNSENIFLRNKIRNSILPFLSESGFENIETNLAKSAFSIASEKKAMSFFIESEFDKLIKRENGDFYFSVSELEKLPQFAIDEILKLIFKNLLKIVKHVSQNKITQLRHFIFQSETGSVFEVENNYHFLIDRGNIVISKIAEDYRFKIDIKDEIIKIKNVGEIKIEKVNKIDKKKYSDSNCEYFNVDIDKKVLYIQNWQKGDKMLPFGMKSKKKVSDILTNSKVEIDRRMKYPVLLADEEIVWIPGIKRADKFSVDDSDEIVYKISFRYSK